MRAEIFAGASLGESNTTALAMRNARGADAGVTRAFLLVQLSGGTRDASATLGSRGTLSLIAVGDDVSLFQKSVSHFTAKKTFVDLESVNFLAAAI